MITLFKNDKVHSLKNLKKVLTDQISRLSSAIEPVGTHLKVIRYEFICERTDILSWLNRQSIAPKIYFAGRDEDYEVAGIGSAQVVAGPSEPDHQKIFEHFEDHLSSDNPNLRYYGGFCFDAQNTDAAWDEFGTYYFVIPRFELLKKDGEFVFAFNISFNDITKNTLKEILALLDKLDFSLTTSHFLPPELKKTVNSPERTDWTEIFEKTHKVILDRQFKKIVLARRSSLEFSTALEAGMLLFALKKTTPQCFHFLIEPNPGHAFIGSSPERLYRRRGSWIESEALAGTKRRGNSPQEDTELKKELLHSTKDNEEHAIVVDSIKRTIQPYCDDFSCDPEPSIFELTTGHHLLTKCDGKLKVGISDAHIFSALHPTPAVAGDEKLKAKEFINNVEPFHRGWYAGTIGYVGFDEAEFTVSIRSGLVTDKTLSLYAGAGIVAASDCAAEWQEIEHKISGFIKILKENRS